MTEVEVSCEEVGNCVWVLRGINANGVGFVAVGWLRGHMSA